MSQYDASNKTIRHEGISKQRKSGTFMWEKIEMTFKSQPNAVSFRCNESFMAYGTVWYDDFRLIKVEEE